MTALRDVLDKILLDNWLSWHKFVQTVSCQNEKVSQAEMKMGMSQLASK